MNISLKDQVRIRQYTVEVLIELFLQQKLDREQIAEIARAVLSETDGITELGDLEKAIHQLVDTYPILKEIEVKESAYLDQHLSENKVNKITELLRRGDLDQAATLASHQSITLQ
jgi:DNA repair protein RadC